MKQKEECNVKQPASVLFGVCTAAYFPLQFIHGQGCDTIL